MCAACRPSSQLEKVSYPSTTKGDVVDDYFGTKVSDPYRWIAALDAKSLDKEQAADLEIMKSNLALSLLELDSIQSYSTVRSSPSNAAPRPRW